VLALATIVGCILGKVKAQVLITFQKPPKKIRPALRMVLSPSLCVYPCLAVRLLYQLEYDLTGVTSIFLEFDLHVQFPHIYRRSEAHSILSPQYLRYMHAIVAASYLSHFLHRHANEKTKLFSSPHPPTHIRADSITLHDVTP
jgi:hypothetical protein